MDMRIAIVTGASSGIGREFVNQIPGFYKHLEEIWRKIWSTNRF